MADIKMNEASWKKNKANTLLDSNDTVANALKKWDSTKSGEDFDKIEKALNALSSAAAALKGKANKTLHKETIGYLQTYIDNCEEALANLKKADGKSLLKNLENLPKSVMEQLKGFDKMFWVSFEDNLSFLSDMKGGKGSKKIYDTYIKKGAKMQVNLDDKKHVQPIEEAMEQDDWTGIAWKEAVDEIKSMVNGNKTQGPAKDGCAKVEKLMQLEGIRKM